MTRYIIYPSAVTQFNEAMNGVNGGRSYFMNNYIWLLRNNEISYFVVLIGVYKLGVSNMPRLARLDTPGLLQHVMAREIERRVLFKDDQDRKSFLERLAIILEETQTQCYVYPV